MTHRGASPGPSTAEVLSLPRHDWAYFLDIDGTLVDIADSPAEVRVDGAIQETVERLYRAAGGAVALISGRPIGDIDGLFPGLHIPTAGQHGVERRNAAGEVSHHAFSSAILDDARRILAGVVARHPSLVLEDKGLSLALHYRRSPRMAGYVHRLVRSVQGRIGPEYSVLTGKRVVEMKPAGKDKGKAVLEFMAEEPFRGRTPVFLGDDITDEHGFATVNRLHGYSIKVGPGRTVARWRLPNVEQAQRWLRQIGAAT